MLMQSHAYTLTVFEDMMPYIVKLVVGGFIMLFVYVLTILVTTCCESLKQLLTLV